MIGLIVVGYMVMDVGVDVVVFGVCFVWSIGVMLYLVIVLFIEGMCSVVVLLECVYEEYIRSQVWKWFVDVVVCFLQEFMWSGYVCFFELFVEGLIVVGEEFDVWVIVIGVVGGGIFGCYWFGSVVFELLYLLIIFVVFVFVGIVQEDDYVILCVMVVVGLCLGVDVLFDEVVLLVGDSCVDL